MVPSKLGRGTLWWKSLDWIWTTPEDTKKKMRQINSIFLISHILSSPVTKFFTFLMWLPYLRPRVSEIMILVDLLTCNLLILQ